MIVLPYIGRHALRWSRAYGKPCAKGKGRGATIVHSPGYVTAPERPAVDIMLFMDGRFCFTYATKSVTNGIMHCYSQ